MIIDQKFLQDHFKYSETLQGLYWIKPTSKYAHPKIGNQYRAGATDSIGYRIVSIFSKSYKEHRLVWIYHNGNIPNNLQIDHINRIRHDNRIENLRLATSSTNGLNTDSKNITFRNNKFKPFEANFMLNGKTLSKSFATLIEAENWVQENKVKAIGAINNYG